MSRRRDPHQRELFGATGAPAEVYPVRRPRESVLPIDLSLRIKTALGQALKECPMSAPQVATAMSEMLGQPITPDTLYTYTAASKPDHQITLLRFKAFVRVTRAWWLWDLLVEDDGLVVMEGREARLAELGLLEQERAALERRLKALKTELRHSPVHVASDRRRRP